MSGYYDALDFALYCMGLLVLVAFIPVLRSVVRSLFNWLVWAIGVFQIGLQARERLDELQSEVISLREHVTRLQSIQRRSSAGMATTRLGSLPLIDESEGSRERL